MLKSKKEKKKEKGLIGPIKIVAVDPSINRVGHACIDNLFKDEKTNLWNAEDAKWNWGTWDLSSNTLSFKLKELADFLILTYGGLDAEAGDILVAEWPQYFDQMRGQIAAKEGHTLNLAAIDAYLFGYFRLPWRQFQPIFPSKWKGNLSKDITRMRFFREIGVKRHYRIDHNAVDAVMMLLWWCKTHGVTNQIINYSVASIEEEQAD